MLANGGQRALGSGPLPRELLRSGSAGAGAGAGAGAEQGGVVAVDAAPYFLEDAERYLFHAAYQVRSRWCVVRGAWCVVRGAWCVAYERASEVVGASCQW